MRHGLGWRGHIPSLHDDRYALRTKFKGVERPPVVELWCDFPYVPDQGDIGGCGACAAVTLMHSVMVQNNLPEWKVRSWQGLYYLYRKQYGRIDQDEGVYNRELLQLMVDVGTPAESLWPSNREVCDWGELPNKYPEALVDASNHQVLAYHAVEGLEEMLQSLAEGYAFMGGMPVYQSFEAVGSSGLVPLPSKSDEMLGGHDLYFYGYNDHGKVLYGINWWGKSWGRDGRFFLPYEYAARMLTGCYAITLQEG